MDLLLEAIKVAISGAVGFFVGRAQTKNSDRIVRTKEAQQRLCDLARTTASDSAQFFSRKNDADERKVRIALIKHQLQRISTDMYELANLSATQKQPIVKAYIPFFEAVTEDPFETYDEFTGIDSNRLQKVASTCEEFVEYVWSLRAM